MSFGTVGPRQVSTLQRWFGRATSIDSTSHLRVTAGRRAKRGSGQGWGMSNRSAAEGRKRTTQE